MREKKLHMLFIPLLAACMFLAAIFGYTYSVKAEDESSAPKIEGLEFQSEMENQFAECFHIYYYNDDYDWLNSFFLDSLFVIRDCHLRKSRNLGLDEGFWLH